MITTIVKEITKNTISSVVFIPKLVNNFYQNNNKNNKQNNNQKYLKIFLICLNKDGIITKYKSI